MAGADTSMQLITGDGVFNASGLDAFVKTVKMTERETSYAVISIMGPQSSGKSTLLNFLFGTKFREMAAEDGRSQTTKGIWLSKCIDIKPFTIIMDIEGNDGRERGEDDTAFEKQSALFALAISDIVLINMWCNDIGREHGANKPLLRTVFQAMIQSNLLRKATLLFVIRDKSKTPEKKLENILKEDIQKIWSNAIKPQNRKGTSFSDVFHVEVVFLSHYDYQFSTFKEEVMSLRQKICRSITPPGLGGDGRKVVPASEFAYSTQEIWKVINGNKELDLPAHAVMVATVRCEAIANEKFATITARKDWVQLRDAQDETITKFRNKLSAILDEGLSRYDMETLHFVEDVRTSKRDKLLRELLQNVRPTYESIFGRMQSKTQSDFEKAFAEALEKGEKLDDAAAKCTKFYLSEFDKQDAASKYVELNPSRIRDKLARDMDAHVATKRKELEKLYKERAMIMNTLGGVATGAGIVGLGIAGVALAPLGAFAVLGVAALGFCGVGIAYDLEKSAEKLKK